MTSMIRFIGELPKKCTVAFSGGVDSVAITDFLLNGKRDLKLAFFHHGTKTSDIAQKFVENFASKRGLELHIGQLTREKKKDESPEEFWRNERHGFFTKFHMVVTAHHLDDALESWIFSSLHGEPKLIPYKSGNVLHPFLVTPKTELIGWAKKRNLEWVEDETNKDTRYTRNRIRHHIVPEALKVNPGLHKVIKKKYLSNT